MANLLAFLLDACIKKGESANFEENLWHQDKNEKIFGRIKRLSTDIKW